MPFFSVIIPLYNKADTIARTLQSVALQTFSDFELIVVDDGSKDGSVAAVERFRASDEWRNCGTELRIIRQENAGPSAARNQGARMARGRFLAMLDGDDTWSPSHLMDLHDVFSQYPHAKVMSTRTAHVDNGVVRRLPKRKECIGPISIFDYPHGTYPVCSDTVTIDREYFLSIGGYNARYSYFEDRELYYRMAEDIGDFYVNWKVSAYYHHDANESASNGKRYAYSEFGYLNLAEQRVAEGTASRRMRRCAASAVNNLIRGNVVRTRFSALCEMVNAFPHLVCELPFVWFCRKRLLWPVLWVEYVGEWIVVRGIERIRVGLFSEGM